jgi:hypothetical protein
MQVTSSGTRTTLEAKFREPNMHFTSSGIGMTRLDKF